MSTKFKLDYKELEEYIKRIESLNLDLKNVTENALKATHQTVKPGINKAISSSPYNFNRTGRTRNSLIKEPKVSWDGSVGAVQVGFDIDNGGLPSIFLMHGTPTIKPDRVLFNSIFGAAVRRKAVAAQSEVFRKRLERAVKG